MLSGRTGLLFAVRRVIIGRDFLATCQPDKIFPRFKVKHVGIRTKMFTEKNQAATVSADLSVRHVADKSDSVNSTLASLHK